MESFLFNNPKIIGVLRNEEGEEMNSTIIRQVSTLKPKARKRIIDLIALISNNDSTILLKIIELKLFAKKRRFFPTYRLFRRVARKKSI